MKYVIGLTLILLVPGLGHGIEKKVPEKDIAVLGLIPEKTNFKAAQQMLGPAHLKESRDAGDYNAQLCYLGPDGTLLLLGSGEMGGSQHDILSVEVAQAGFLKPSFPCGASPKINSAMSFLSGLRLGQSIAEVQKIWGKPSKSTPDSLTYDFHSTTPIDGQAYDDTITLWVTFKKGRLVDSVIARVLSN